MSYHFSHLGTGSADSSTRQGVVAEPMGPACGDVIDAASWVKGGGVTSAFIFIDDNMLVSILMGSQALPLCLWTWASR